jgi:hypothetical protein
MADNTTNESILFEVKINAEQYKAEQKQIKDSLGQLTLSIDKTKAAQAALKKERDTGKLSDAQYAEQSVKLRTELNQQRASQRELEKGLRTSQQAYGSAAGSIDQLKARAAELTIAYNAMGKEERTATEAGQRLTTELLEVNKALLGGGAAVNDFRRNVGNYPKGESLAPLVQQLVKLEEAMKAGVLTAEQAAEADAAVIGYKQRIAQAGAQEGKSYEETTALVKTYGDAIRPATQALVQLEQEQQQVAGSGKAVGEQIAQIGFRFGQARKSIQDATDALKEAPDAAQEAGSAISGALGQASEAAAALGVDVGGIESGFARAKRGVDIAKGAFSSLRTTMLAVPIFALLAALTALVAYFTKTREGANQLETMVAKIGATFDVIIDRAGVLGKAVAQLFSGEFRAAAETARQSYKGIGDEIQREIVLAGQLSKQRQQLERDEINNIATNKTLLNQVERLKNVRDNEFNSIQKRKTANEDAYKAELQREKTLTDVAQRKVDLLKAEADRRGGLDKLGNEQLREYQEAVNAVADIQEDAAGKQNELITNRYQLEQESIEKVLERRRQALAVEAALLTQRLAQVQQGSNEELNLLQRKLRNERAVELAQKGLTAAQKRVIDLKYNTDSTALLVSFQRQAALSTLQAEQERNSASLAANKQAQAERAAQGLQATQQQLEDEYQLQSRAAVLERELALAGLNQRADNEAAKLRIRAEASQKLAALDAAQADAERQRRAKELSDEAQHYNLLADAMLAGRTQAEQQQLAASETYQQQRIAAVLDEQDARLALVAQGSQEEANILLDAENRIKQIRAESAQAQLDLLQQQTAKIASVVSGSLSSLSALQDSDSQAKLARIDAEMNAEGVSAARKAVLEKQKLRVEQQAAEQRKRIAKAEAIVNLGAAVLQILKSPAAPFVEPAASIVRGLEIAAATATAYAQIRAIDSAKFAAGGLVAIGPSHAQGGIQLTRQGRAVGIEIEGGEAIINKRSTALFGSVLSAINQLGGGRPLYVDPLQGSALMARLAVGGVVPANLPDYLPQVRTASVVVHTPPIDYDALAAAIANRPNDHEALAETLASKLATQLTPAFVAGARALPPQNVNLTELRERNTQLDKRDAETNI